MLKPSAGCYRCYRKKPSSCSKDCNSSPTLCPARVLHCRGSCPVTFSWLFVMGNAFSEFFLAFERNLSGCACKRGCLKTKTGMLPVVNPRQIFSQRPFFLIRKVLGHLWYVLKLKQVSLEEQMQHLLFPVWVELFSCVLPAAVFSPLTSCHSHRVYSVLSKGQGQTCTAVFVTVGPLQFPAQVLYHPFI